MPKFEFTSSIKRKARIAKLSVSEVALANLVFLGWDKTDAMGVCGLFNPAYSVKANLHNLELLTESEPFAKYYSELVKKAEEEKEQLAEISRKYKSENQVPTENGEGFDFRSKDAIINQLGSVAETLKGKEKAEVLMKIADLQQMKKEEVKEEDERVHFYVPLTCHKCSHYKNYGQPNLAKD